jgi:GAF domain-containing protein
MTLREAALFLVGSSGGILVGYGLRWLYEDYRRRQLERVLRALGGELPDWEVAARDLEKHAVVQSRAGKYEHARLMRCEADTIRLRGRRRDRQWT